MARIPTGGSIIILIGPSGVPGGETAVAPRVRCRVLLHRRVVLLGPALTSTEAESLGALPAAAASASAAAPGEASPTE